MHYRVGDRVVVKVLKNRINDTEEFQKASGTERVFTIIGSGVGGGAYTIHVDDPALTCWSIGIESKHYPPEFRGKKAWEVTFQAIGRLVAKRKCHLCS